jgi:hypothetical protein
MPLDLSFRRRLSVFVLVTVAILFFLNSWEPTLPPNTFRVGEPSVFIDTGYGVPLFMLIPVCLGWVGIAAGSRAGVVTCFVLSTLIALLFWVYYEMAKRAGIF